MVCSVEKMPDMLSGLEGLGHLYLKLESKFNEALKSLGPSSEHTDFIKKLLADAEALVAACRTILGCQSGILTQLLNDSMRLNVIDSAMINDHDFLRYQLISTH